MRRNNKWSIQRILLLLGICCVLAGTAYIVWLPETPAVATEKKITFNGTDLKEERDGKLVWKLTAKQIEVNPKTQALVLIEPRGEFHDGDVVLTMSAKEGQLAGNHDTMELTGDVKATSTDGATFTTKEVTYDTKKNTFTAKGGFTYENESVTLTGDTLTGNTVLENITVAGHAKLVKR